MKTPQEIIQQMLVNDQFSNWLGIRVEHLEKGKCILKMTVSAIMLNGHHIAHGGISYALADSALAFAANSYGRKAVSIESAISHIKTVQVNDVLIATTTVINCGKNIGRFDVQVTNGKQELVAKFNGTVFFTEEYW
jgi:acyl-CoA thioesterase